MTGGIALYLRNVYDGESELEHELHKVAERHRTDHEIYHAAINLARWSQQNRQQLSAVAPAGEHLDADHDATSAGPLTQLREKTAEMLGRRPEPGLLLLHDLRHLYLMASGNSVYWTILGQAAQATHDERLLQVVTECHGKTMRQVVWCNATIKALAPQLVPAAL